MIYVNTAALCKKLYKKGSNLLLKLDNHLLSNVKKLFSILPESSGEGAVWSH